MIRSWMTIAFASLSDLFSVDIFIYLGRDRVTTSNKTKKLFGLIGQSYEKSNKISGNSIKSYTQLFLISWY